jgi:hypothetical protein
VSPPWFAVSSVQERFAPQSHIVAARANGSGDRQRAVVRRRTCEENRKLQLARRDSGCCDCNEVLRCGVGSHLRIGGSSLQARFRNPRGADAPRSCVAVRMSASEKRFLRWTNACSQERRASARREMLTPVQSRTFSTVGLRRPLLVHDERPLNKAPSAVHQRTCIRAAGVSPPWLATSHVCRAQRTMSGR